MLSHRPYHLLHCVACTMFRLHRVVPRVAHIVCHLVSPAPCRALCRLCLVSPTPCVTRAMCCTTSHPCHVLCCPSPVLCVVLPVTHAVCCTASHPCCVSHHQSP